MNCPKCNTQIGNDATFCGACGADVSSFASSPEHTSPPPPATGQDSTPPPPPPPPPQTFNYPSTPKTNLGISVGLFGAALYFSGIISFIVLVLLAGYVLLREQDKWLRRAAVKAVGIVVFFNIFSAIGGLASNSTTFLNNVVLLFNGTITLTNVNRVITLFLTAVSFIQILILLIMAFRALRMTDSPFSAVDNVIDKNM